MAFARTDTLDQRLAILDRLTLRNRVVAVLRIAVPALGLAAFVGLLAQIYIANTLHQYGVAGVRIDRGNLVVETPQYSGIGSDGSRYVVSAREARAPLGSPNAIEMIDATLDFTRPGKAHIRALATSADFDTTRQLLAVPGVTSIQSDDGMHGTLTELRSDQTSEITTTDGPVSLTFPNGTNLKAMSMRYEGKTATWTFVKATLTVPTLPAGQPLPAVPLFALGGWVRL